MGWLIRGGCSGMLAVNCVLLISYLPLNRSQMDGYCVVKLRTAYNHTQLILDTWYYLLKVLLSTNPGLIIPALPQPQRPPHHRLISGAFRGLMLEMKNSSSVQ